MQTVRFYNAWPSAFQHRLSLTEWALCLLPVLLELCQVQYMVCLTPCDVSFIPESKQNALLFLSELKYIGPLLIVF